MSATENPPREGAELPLSGAETPPSGAEALRSGAEPPRSGERIAKLLARAGIASRREVERIIAEGRVKIGGETVTTPATVLANLKGVTVDGEPVKMAEPARLFAFHKPSGLITAERDPTGRPTIYTALRNALPPGTPRVMPVGRLDLNTEGLLMLTNDGELKRAMELPSSGIPRTYRARTFGPVTQGQLEELMVGIEIDGFHYGSINANMERSTGHNQWIELTLTEGKNREVRRVLEHLGLQVSRLLRTAYGPFVLADLPRGAAVEIRQVDVERCCKALKLPGTMASITPQAVEKSSVPVKRAVVAAPAPAPAKRSGRPGADGTPKPRTAGRDAPRSGAEDKPRRDAPRRGPDDKPRRGAAVTTRYAGDDVPWRPAEDSPRRDAAETPRRGGEDKPKRAYGDAPRRASGDAPRRGPGEKPRGTASDPARRSLVDKPRRGFGDGPRRGVEERPHRDASDAPRRGASDAPRRGASDTPRRATDDKPRGTLRPVDNAGKPPRGAKPSGGFKPGGFKPSGGSGKGPGKPRPGGGSKPRSR